MKKKMRLIEDIFSLNIHDEAPTPGEVSNTLNPEQSGKTVEPEKKPNTTKKPETKDLWKSGWAVGSEKGSKMATEKYSKLFSSILKFDEGKDFSNDEDVIEQINTIKEILDNKDQFDAINSKTLSEKDELLKIGKARNNELMLEIAQLKKGYEEDIENLRVDTKINELLSSKELDLVDIGAAKLLITNEFTFKRDENGELVIHRADGSEARDDFGIPLTTMQQVKKYFQEKGFMLKGNFINGTGLTGNGRPLGNTVYKPTDDFEAYRKAREGLKNGTVVIEN